MSVVQKRKHTTEETNTNIGFDGTELLGVPIAPFKGKIVKV